MHTNSSKNSIQHRLARGQDLESRLRSDLDPSQVLPVVDDLIDIYEHEGVPQEQRRAASQLVARLSARHVAALERVIEHARHYAPNQHIDDAYPAHPNSFDVLASVYPPDDRVVAFLRDVIKQDYGTPRWTALAALCRMDSQAAAVVVDDVIAGKYPPCKLTDADDRVIIATLGRVRAAG